MTDKEWYAKLTTIVLEGIELVNKGADQWDIYKNQRDLRDFMRCERLPDERKKEAIKSAKQCIANVIMWGGFAAAGAVLFFDMILWTEIFLGDSGYVLGAVVSLAISIALCGIGVIGKYYDALLRGPADGR